MFKSLVLAAVAIVGLQTNAMESQANIAVQAVAHQTVLNFKSFHGLNWTVGDSADYNLNGGIIQGTMHMFVRETSDVGFWMEQDMDLGALGQQKVEVNINKDNGQIVDMIVNGQKQTPPAADDEEIVDSHKDNVTVPAGTFDCFWVKIHSKSQNNDSQSWLNPTAVPIAGMIKTIAPSQIGDITIELTGFKKN
jgi:hypothetical protein